MSVVVNYVVTQKAHALSAGIAIVRRILKDHKFPDGFTTKRMYELSQSYPPPPNFMPMKPPTSGTSQPPRLDHPIRSISFLKTMILPALEGQKEITMVSQSRSGMHPLPNLTNIRPAKQVRRLALSTEFVWKVVPPQERQKVLAVGTRGKTSVDIGGGGGGVDGSEDISHLNKRRQRARVTKVTEAVLKLKGSIPFSKELRQVASTPLQ